MLRSVSQHGVGVALYDGYYSSPAVCGLEPWMAYFATAEGENLVVVGLGVVRDRGHFIAGLWEAGV